MYQHNYKKYSYSTIVPNHLVVGVDGKEGKFMEVHPIVLLFASACSDDFFACHIALGGSAPT